MRLVSHEWFAKNMKSVLGLSWDGLEYTRPEDGHSKSARNEGPCTNGKERMDRTDARYPFSHFSDG
jgi:hypothetical protein